ncbi:MAG: alpha/beta fold hydrolase [Phycisphaerae bacterium]|nr:alpha/beta fold hydrolase [Phycisphaerae bacterium]
MKHETLERGRGAPLLMLHGMMGEPGNWSRLSDHLPESCRMIALRFPFFEDGHKLNSVPAVTDYAQDYVEQAGLERFAVCGNSLGGHVAIDLAIRMPQRVCGLVLSGSSGLFERTFGTVVTRPPRSWVREKIREIFHDDEHVTEEMVDRVIGVISSRRNVRTLIQIAKSAKRDNVAERLRSIQCPALLIWGRQDEITPPSVAEEFHRNLPNSELHWLEACGHAPMLEYPEQFAQALGRWWRGHIHPDTSRRQDGVAT